jgi:O-antigen/teichoic acid export membrane protein
MNRLIEWIDRLKLVEGVIFFGTVWFGVEWVARHFGGVLGIVVAIVSAAILYTSYFWWRRKGIFRNRS